MIKVTCVTTSRTQDASRHMFKVKEVWSVLLGLQLGQTPSLLGNEEGTIKRQTFLLVLNFSGAFFYPPCLTPLPSVPL